MQPAVRRGGINQRDSATHLFICHKLPTWASFVNCNSKQRENIDYTTWTSQITYHWAGPLGGIITFWQQHFAFLFNTIYVILTALFIGHFRWQDLIGKMSSRGSIATGMTIMMYIQRSWNNQRNNMLNLFGSIQVSYHLPWNLANKYFSCPEIFSPICHWDPILLMTLWFMAQNRAIIQIHKNWVTWSKLYIVPAFLTIKMWNITLKKCAVFPIYPGVFPFRTII